MEIKKQLTRSNWLFYQRDVMIKRGELNRTVKLTFPHEHTSCWYLPSSFAMQPTLTSGGTVGNLQFFRWIEPRIIWVKVFTAALSKKKCAKMFILMNGSHFFSFIHWKLNRWSSEEINLTDVLVKFATKSVWITLRMHQLNFLYNHILQQRN